MYKKQNVVTCVRRALDKNNILLIWERRKIKVFNERYVSVTLSLRYRYVIVYTQIFKRILLRFRLLISDVYQIQHPLLRKGLKRLCLNSNLMVLHISWRLSVATPIVGNQRQRGKSKLAGKERNGEIDGIAGEEISGRKEWEESNGEEERDDREIEDETEKLIIVERR